MSAYCWTCDSFHTEHEEKSHYISLQRFLMNFLYSLSVSSFYTFFNNCTSIKNNFFPFTAQIFISIFIYFYFLFNSELQILNIVNINLKQFFLLILSQERSLVNSFAVHKKCLFCVCVCVCAFKQWFSFIPCLKNHRLK